MICEFTLLSRFGKSFNFVLSCVYIISSSLNTSVTVYFNITFTSKNVSSIIQLPDEVCALFFYRILIQMTLLFESYSKFDGEYNDYDYDKDYNYSSLR